MEKDKDKNKNKDKGKDKGKVKEEVFKIITIGDTQVGKTCILLRYIQNQFSENTLQTIGFDKNYKDLILKCGKKIKLCVIDTAGQEKYNSLNKNYVKNVDGVLFVFDLSNKTTFYNIKKWLDFFNANNNSLKKIPKYLNGNKKDLPREVNSDMVDIIIDENKELKYKETSAKDDNDNQINELFQEMGEQIYTFYSKNSKNKGRNIKKLSECKENEIRECFCL